MEQEKKRPSAKLPARRRSQAEGAKKTNRTQDNANYADNGEKRKQRSNRQNGGHGGGKEAERNKKQIGRAHV